MTEEDGAAFLQRRLRQLLGITAAIGWAVFVAHLVTTHVLPDNTQPNALLVDTGISTLPLGATSLWWFVRASRPRSLAVSSVIEAGTLVFYEAVCAVLIAGGSRIEDAYVSLSAASTFLFGRALLIPSSWGRTLRLSATAIALPFAALVWIALVHPDRSALPTATFLANCVFWCAIPVAMATVSSRIITGLREQVRDAKRLGQYTLGEKLGEGGMGAVYKARHALLRRPTAIKVLRPDRGGEDAIRRFEREVQITASLTDPHIVAIFDYGRSADGTFYYAMEYLDGVDLERLVRQYGPQPPGRVVAIVRQVCEALAEAHAGGLIHRDIKPANILLCERGLRPDAVKVVDFGLVQHVDAAETGVSGTPGYLSPEAIEDPARVGPASDLYALGAVVYFLLTGETVFVAQTFAEMCAHHLESTPIAPSVRAVRPFPAELDALVLACLAKDPAARPASAVVLRAALDALDVAPWTTADAESWWAAFRAPARAAQAPTVVDPVGQTVALAPRP